MKFALIAAVALSLVMAFLAVQNSQQAEVTFLKWYFDGPMVIILLLTFGAGVLTAVLAMLPGSVRKSIEISKFKSSIAENLSKIEALEKHQKTKESQINQETEGKEV